MRARTIDLTPVATKVSHFLGNGPEDRLVRTLARHPWVLLLASWTLGKTYEHLVDKQAKREMLRRPRF